MDTALKDKTITAYIAVTIPARTPLQKAKEILDVVRQQGGVIGASFVLHKDGYFNHAPKEEFPSLCDEIKTS